ncbi:MAG: primosomal protein N' [Thiotrichales bacterium]
MGLPNNIARIALATPIDDLIDYLPGILGGQLLPGVRVRVMFGRRRMVGVFIAWAASSAVASDRLKPIIEVLDAAPLLPSALLELLRRGAQYYHHPFGEVVLHALPTLLREGHTGDSPATTRWYAQPPTPAATDALSRAPAQKALLDYLARDPAGCSLAELRTRFRSANAGLKALAAKGLARSESIATPCDDSGRAEHATAPVLNHEQSAALQAITETPPGFAVHLLEGVTGSGKTEVYLALIERTLAEGRQVLVLAPEISLTPQLQQRFRARLGVAVVSLHSGLSPPARLAGWQHARSGAARVVIGTRSAVFTPLPGLGLIVVDEEHDGSLKQQEGFRYHGRDLAILRARIDEVPIVLGSATPSLESLANVARGLYARHRLTARAGAARAPSFQLVDLRRQQLDAGLSRHLFEAMQRHLDDGHQVLLFLNRRGYAPVLLCHECGTALDCPHCTAHTTYHARANALHCHHCGHVRRAPSQCPSCGGNDLVAIGIGTERLEEHIRARFPHHPVLRLDRDATRRKGELEARLAEIARGDFRIIIGTQLLAKGHDFPNLTLVGVIDVDQGLFSTDFRAPERLVQQVLQVGGRAGRGSSAGEVILQTHQPDHPLLRQLLSADYPALAESMLHLRQAAGWPPYRNLALIRASAPQADDAERFLDELATLARAEAENALEVLGPVPAPLARKAGRHRFLLLLRSDERRDLHRLLRPLKVQAGALKSARAVRWSVDVDPVDIG